MEFFVLDSDILTENAGKITICYAKLFEKKIKKICKKHRNFLSDFKLFKENALKNSLNIEGEILNANTKPLQRVGADQNVKAYKVKKFFSSNFNDSKSVRIDYIFSNDKNILFFIDLRLKNNNNEANHDKKMISACMKIIKDGIYKIS